MNLTVTMNLTSSSPTKCLLKTILLSVNSLFFLIYVLTVLENVSNGKELSPELDDNVYLDQVIGISINLLFGLLELYFIYSERYLGTCIFAFVSFIRLVRDFTLVSNDATDEARQLLDLARPSMSLVLFLELPLFLLMAAYVHQLALHRAVQTTYKTIV